MRLSIIRPRHIIVREATIGARELQAPLRHRNALPGLKEVTEVSGLARYGFQQILVPRRVMSTL